MRRAVAPTPAGGLDSGRRRDDVGGWRWFVLLGWSIGIGIGIKIPPTPLLRKGGFWLGGGCGFRNDGRDS